MPSEVESLVNAAQQELQRREAVLQGSRPMPDLEGRTVVETGARVGPGCRLRDTTVAAGATVINAVCESAVIGPDAVVGPFVYLPPGTRVAPGARVGRQDRAAVPEQGAQPK